MSDLTPLNKPDNLHNLESLSDDDLINVIADALRLTVRGVRTAAYAIRILEARGRDLSDLRLALYHSLRKVAHGMLLPEAFVRFAGKPALLGRIANLPTPEQKWLADGGAVRLVEFVAGQQTHRMIDPLKATPNQIAQVFAPDHIRDDQEQLNILSDRREKESRKQRPEVEHVGKAKVDRVAKVVRVGNYVFTFDEWRRINRLLGD